MLENGLRKSVFFEILINISKYYGVPLDYFTIFLCEEESPEKEISDIVRSHLRWRLYGQWR
jgi:transcriptional regulator with XRE-family HTH domain